MIGGEEKKLVDRSKDGGLKRKKDEDVERKMY
jgi:hypothetical protein